jgi:hypothetical protein
MNLIGIILIPRMRIDRKDQSKKEIFKYFGKHDKYQKILMYGEKVY